MLALFLLISNNYRNVLVTQIVVSALTLGLMRLLLLEYNFFIYNTARWTYLHTLLEMRGGFTDTRKQLLQSQELTSDVLVQLTALDNNPVYEAAREELSAQSTYSVVWFLRF